jgi:iron(III) transport system permease protein
LLNNTHKLLWTFCTALVALVLCLPLLSILVLAANPAGGAWQHFATTVLPQYLSQTLMLLAGVGALTLIVGVALAWLISFYDFPLRTVLQWLVLLPLSMPAYIVAFIFVDFFNYAGPLQTNLRAMIGWQRPSDYYFPDIRSIGGAILVLGFSLYPYVYLSARAVFLKQSMNQVDVARTLGKSPLQVLTGIILPQARPAIIVGLMLVLMECMNDIAAVGFFGVQTLTLGIYSAWLGQNDLGSAAQMAFVILLLVTAFLTIERHARKVQLRLQNNQRQKPIQRVKLRCGWIATLLCVMPFVIGFLLPAILLFAHASRRLNNFIDGPFLQASGNSLLLATAACLITLGAGLVLAYANRISGSKLIRVLTVFSTLGYAVPGTVLAIGIMVAFGKFDNGLDVWMRAHFSVSTGLLLSGGIAGVLLAYVARFMMIAFGTLENGLEKITPNIDAVARTLGRGTWAVIRDIHIPLLRPALVTAALLVFVDAMKELPATLLLRPFGFDSLATQVYALASLEKLEDSSVPALAIVLAGLIPVILLSRSLRDPAMKSPQVNGTAET